MHTWVFMSERIPYTGSSSTFPCSPFILHSKIMSLSFWIHER